MQLINDFHDICSFVFKLLYFDCFGGFVCFGWRLFGFPFWKGGVLYLLGFFLWMFWNFEEFTRFANTKLCLLNEIIFTNPYLHVLLLKTIHQQKNQLKKKKKLMWPMGHIAHLKNNRYDKMSLMSIAVLKKTANDCLCLGYMYKPTSNSETFLRPKNRLQGLKSKQF